MYKKYGHLLNIPSEIGLKTVISHLFSGYFSYCYPLRSTIFSLYIPCVLLFL